MQSRTLSPGVRKASALLVAQLFLTVNLLGWQPAAALAGPSATLSPAEKAAAELIKTDNIRAIVEKLSSKEMEGRGTGTPGGERAARYIAGELAGFGFKPLGDEGTFLQNVPFRSTEISPNMKVRIGGVGLDFPEDFVLAPPLPSEPKEVSGGTVFVGYGVVSEDLNRNDLEGIDVKGKVVILLSGKPDNVDQAKWAQAANPQTIAIGLIGKGAAGIVLTNVNFGGKPYPVIADYLSRRSVALAENPGPGFNIPPIILMGDPGVEKVFAGTGKTFAAVKAQAAKGEFVSMDLNKPSTISVVIDRQEVVAHNVVGVLEGSDPELKKQAVVYSAHYDAFGIGSEGQIYPGAADNALGVAEILSIARAFANSENRPRRSIVVLAVTGEEHGLLGARYWTAHPTWPLADIAAVLNFDGIGTEVYAPVRQVVGFGAEYSDLGAVMERVVTEVGAQVVPDPMPEEKAFYRSDHYEFVKKGVPALMLLGGPATETEKWIAKAKEWLEVDYHQTTDTIKPDWSWEGAQDLAIIGLVIGMRVANADAMPQWLPSAPFKRSGAETKQKAAGA